MRIEVLPVSPWQANCCVIGPDDGDACIVVDPGITAWPSLEGVLDRTGLVPAGVLVTHGHLDHVGDAHLIAARFGIPVHCALPDQPMLEVPSRGLGPQSLPLLEQLMGGDRLPLPRTVRGLSEPFEMAGLSITPFAAPGHTQGSTLLEISDGTESVVLTGDVLFAGTIGRTDLPGGSMQAMRATLRAILDRFGDDVPLVPGHGPATTLAAEKATNPYLQPDFLR